MQLKYNRQKSLGSSLIITLIKLSLATIFLIIIIFLIEKKFRKTRMILEFENQMLTLNVHMK